MASYAGAIAVGGPPRVIDVVGRRGLDFSLRVCRSCPSVRRGRRVFGPKSAVPGYRFGLVMCRFPFKRFSNSTFLRGGLGVQSHYFRDVVISAGAVRLHGFRGGARCLDIV